MTAPDLSPGLRDQLREAVATRELTSYDEAILAAARPAIHLEYAEDTGPDEPLGTSRLGGDPDLPEDVPWPAHDGRRLTFMAQLAMSDLGVPEGWPLPREGTLSIFKGDDEDRFEVPHRVLYLPPGTALVRRSTPEEPPPSDEGHPRLGCKRLRFEPGISIPGYGDAELDAMDLGDEELDRYLDLCQDLDPIHGKLLGRDRDVDEPPTRERARQVLGDDHDFAWLKAHPEEVAAEAARWAPLVELGSCHAVNLCMWDYYAFLVLVPWEDLAAGRWDRTHGTLART
jgi:hypothetical protein